MNLSLIYAAPRCSLAEADPYVVPLWTPLGSLPGLIYVGYKALVPRRTPWQPYVVPIRDRHAGRGLIYVALTYMQALPGRGRPLRSGPWVLKHV